MYARASVYRIVHRPFNRLYINIIECDPNGFIIISSAVVNFAGEIKRSRFCRRLFVYKLPLTYLFRRVLYVIFYCLRFPETYTDGAPFGEVGITGLFSRKREPGQSPWKNRLRLRVTVRILYVRVSVGF